MSIIEIIRFKQYEKYVDSYLEQTEYKNMVKDLNCIFDSMINLSDIFNFSKDIEKLALAYFLVNVGYFSSSGRYYYNNNIEEIGMGSNHAINYVSIDNDEFFIEGDFPLDFYYGDDGLAFHFLQDNSVINHYLLYNYSFCYDEKKNYDKIKKIPVDRQLEILANYKKTIKLIDDNIDIVIESYKENMPYMVDIKDTYQKVYTKERKYRKWLEK